MSKTVTSGGVTFLDVTDNRKLDAYITSNLPIAQIFDQNTKTYNPDWNTTNLQLSADIYLDAKTVTTNAYTSITWYKKVGTQAKTQVGTGAKLTVNGNQLIGNVGIITYICEATYNDTTTNPPTAHAEITFTRVDTGLNGYNGKDGTGVTILGSYTTLTELQTAHPTGNAGDAYIVDGDLYVWAIDDAQWENVGNIQGPAGADGRDAKNIILTGDSQVFKVSKTNVITPSIIKVTAYTFNTTVTNWTYSTNGGQTFVSTAPTGVSRSGNIVTITGSNIPSNSITIKASDGEIEDVLTVYKAIDGTDGGKGNDGAPAPIVFLTNENITFSANAQGQISGTTIISKVVAYNGTTKVMPTLRKNTDGTPAITGMPDGMSITTSEITASNEVMLTITITNNSTLGSALNNMGTISIPVTSPVSTVLTLIWSKVNSGAIGVGIKSTTVTYGVSDSASTKPADTAWQSTIPTVADGKYLWTRTIIDYTDDAITDTVTYTYAKQGIKGDTGSTGSSVVVSSIQYQEGASATIPPTSTWSNSVVAVAEGKFLWTKTTFSDGKTAYGVAKQGVSGKDGANGSDAYTVILTNESHIFAGDVSNAIAGTATTQVLAYKGSTSQSVTIVSVDGKTASTSDTDTSIAGLKFKCSALSGVTPTITFTCTTAFVSRSGSIPIVLSVGDVQFTKMFTYSIAFKGSTGAQGATGQVGTPASLVDITPSAHYFKSTTGKDGTFTPDYIYLYPRFQTVTFSSWQYSINGGTTWVAASGANGLSIGTYNSVANTLRIAKTSTLYTDTVTSISFRCVSSNALVYDTVSIAKIYDVVDLEIGGRNLLQRTENTLKTSTINTNKYGVIGQFVPSTQSWKNGYVNISEYGLSIGDTLTFQAYLAPQNEMPVAVRAWGSDNGTSGSPLKDGNYLLEPGVSSCTFIMTHPYIYLGVAVQNTITESITEKYSNCKLERGNKATDWSPAPEDMISITFQLYAPKGSLITKDVPEVTLETFAYDGSQSIVGATFEWYSLIDDIWTIISGATGTSLTLNKDSVLKSNVYKCKMTYKEKIYEATATVEDKTDIYESIMCISSNARGNDCYWVLYTLVYTDAEEVDPLLGPISINAPTSPVSGDYWYAVDASNASVQLKKYNGTNWANSTDTQSLSYYWDIVNDGSIKVPFGNASKVQVISCHDFTSTATLVCEVNNTEDGLLTQSSLSLTDASDPIVSTTEPTGMVDGQIWIKPNDNGTYFMSVWNATEGIWITSDMDSRTKVHTSRPSSYSVGDLWVTASDTDHNDYLGGTLLQANTTSATYNASHWSATLKYDKDLDKIKETLNDLSEYVNITSEGLKIGAMSLSGEISPFTSLFTSTELAFYQNSEKLLTLTNSQLIAPHVVVEDEIEVQGSINLGNLKLTIESNGSFSFAVLK